MISPFLDKYMVRTGLEPVDRYKRDALTNRAKEPDEHDNVVFLHKNIW